MRDDDTIRRRRETLAQRRRVLVTYRDECARIGDHHGVQDASSDLREVEAVDAALAWALGGTRTLDY